MTTKLIGLKEFRLNLSKYTKQVESQKVRLIVLKKNKPVLEINPIKGKFLHWKRWWKIMALSKIYKSILAKSARRDLAKLEKNLAIRVCKKIKR